jgi:hypothetical protein
LAKTTKRELKSSGLTLLPHHGGKSMDTVEPESIHPALTLCWLRVELQRCSPAAPERNFMLRLRISRLKSDALVREFFFEDDMRRLAYERMFFSYDEFDIGVMFFLFSELGQCNHGVLGSLLKSAPSAEQT